MSSLSGNLQRFGMDKVHKLELLQEIIAKMLEDTGAAFGHKEPRMTASAESKRLYQELKPLSECGKDSLCGCRIFGWRALRLLLGPRQTVNCQQINALLSIMKFTLALLVNPTLRSSPIPTV